MSGYTIKVAPYIEGNITYVDDLTTYEKNGETTQVVKVTVVDKPRVHDSEGNWTTGEEIKYEVRFSGRKAERVHATATAHIGKAVLIIIGDPIRREDYTTKKGEPAFALKVNGIEMGLSTRYTAIQ